MIDFEVLTGLIDKEGEIRPSREKYPSLYLAGQWIHSRFAPWKEAERLVEPLSGLDPDQTLVICFGVGLGYHLHLLEQKGFSHFVILELDPQSWLYFQKIYKLGKKSYWLSPTDPPEQLDAIFTEIKIEEFKHIKTIVLRGGYDQEKYGIYETRLQRLMQVKLGDFTTRFYFEELWFINILKNITHLSGQWLANDLRCSPHSIPVVIVSAGPSLRQSLDYLAAIQKKCLIIAVDTALLVLFEAGIQADFVYCLDSQVHNLSDFSGIDKEYLAQTNLIYDLVVNPALLNFKTVHTIAANTAHLDMDASGNPTILKHPLISWLEEKLSIRIGDVETGGSVATSAFHLGYLLGGDPLVLTGQDLAYSWNTSHCPSTSHYYRIQRSTHRLKTIDSVFLNVISQRKTKTVKGVQGEVLTDNSLSNYRKWFEESGKNLLKGKSSQVINATTQGAHINFFQEINIKQLAEKWAQFPDIDKSYLFSGKQEWKNKYEKENNQIFSNLEKFIKNLCLNEAIFDILEKSEYPFLERYFLKEKTLFKRFGQFDSEIMKRKIRRLLKTIAGALHEQE